MNRAPCPLLVAPSVRDARQLLVKPLNFIGNVRFKVAFQVENLAARLSERRTETVDLVGFASEVAHHAFFILARNLGDEAKRIFERKRLGLLAAQVARVGGGLGVD